MEKEQRKIKEISNQLGNFSWKISLWEISSNGNPLPKEKQILLRIDIPRSPQNEPIHLRTYIPSTNPFYKITITTRTKPTNLVTKISGYKTFVYRSFTNQIADAISRQISRPLHTHTENTVYSTRILTLSLNNPFFHWKSTTEELFNTVSQIVEQTLQQYLHNEYFDYDPSTHNYTLVDDFHVSVTVNIYYGQLEETHTYHVRDKETFIPPQFNPLILRHIDPETGQLLTPLPQFVNSLLTYLSLIPDTHNILKSILPFLDHKLPIHINIITLTEWKTCILTEWKTYIYEP